VSHDGAVVGVSSLLTLLPEHGVAIVQLANSDSKHLANEVIAKDIVQAIPSISTNYKAASSASLHQEPIASSALRPVIGPAHIAGKPIDISQFAGTYSDTGYGDYVFCHPPHEKYGAHFSDRRCRQFHSDYAAVEDIVGLSATKLYGYMKRPMSGTEYLTLTLLPMDAHIDLLDSQLESTITFELLYARVFPQGFGADERPFVYGTSPGSGARVVFSLTEGDVHGFGIFGFAGQVLMREKRGANVEERAEVWFDKVSV
jgi:hypothetical protein